MNNDIILDLDGTLSSNGANSWVAPDLKHLTTLNSDCAAGSGALAGTTLCSSNVQLRRVEFKDANPTSNFESNDYLRVLRYDFDTSATDLETYLLDSNNYQEFRPNQFITGSKSWAVPFVTGNKFKFHWTNSGRTSQSDFDSLNVEMSERW